MTTAIIYSGIPHFDRNVLLTHDQYIKNIYKPDIFIHTYSNSHEDIKTIDNLCKHLEPSHLIVENFNDALPMLNALSGYVKTHNPETKIINCLSMFYKIHQSFKMIETRTYDIIIRNRLDISFDAPLEIHDNEMVNVPCGGDHYGGLLDLFAYGSYNVMKSYASLFDFLPLYLGKLEQKLHPESILRFHCNYHNIPIERFDFNVYLRGMLFTQTAPCIR
jgi:hypothetical protein